MWASHVWLIDLSVESFTKGSHLSVVDVRIEFFSFICSNVFNTV